tara:strand:+ start:111 stop:581 length:471 start_codon:yes stop_codon:yes gene_type:complete
MKKTVLVALIGWAVLAGQAGSNLQIVRNIRLENLKRDYLGESIRFMGSNSRSIQGVLLDVTEKNIIISEHGTPVPYDHSGVNYIFVDPEFKDMIMVFGLGALGGVAGYLGVIIVRSNPDANMKGVVSSLGVGLAGFTGYRAFYKPFKIDISGKVRD